MICSLFRISLLSFFISLALPTKFSRGGILDHPRTIASGGLLCMAIGLGMASRNKSQELANLIDRKCAREKAQALEKVDELNNSVIQRMVPRSDGDYEAEFHEINWMNFYKSLKDKDLSKKLLKLSSDARMLRAISAIAGLCGLACLFTAPAHG